MYQNSKNKFLSISNDILQIDIIDANVVCTKFQIRKKGLQNGNFSRSYFKTNARKTSLFFISMSFRVDSMLTIHCWSLSTIHPWSGNSMIESSIQKTKTHFGRKFIETKDFTIALKRPKGESFCMNRILCI